MKEITKRANGTVRVRTINNEPSRTQKQFKDDVNINKIMSRYKKTGQLNHLRNAESGAYMDLSDMTDLLSAKLQLQEAERLFRQIPPKVRLQFENDPAKLGLWLSDPKNKDEAIHLGLLIKRDEPNLNQNDANKQTTAEASPKS